jgi:hypothetical protein
MLSFMIFPLAMVGFFVLSEKIMSSKSRWNELSSRYRETSTPTLSWRGCRYLETEAREGNRIYRVTYGSNRLSAAMRLFPRVSVAVDAKGLHLKRQPWHFMHPPLLIPWTAIADIETMSSADFGARQLARRTGISEQATRGRVVPGAMGRLINLAGGSMTTVTLANPRMTLTVPAGRIEAPERFLLRRDRQTPVAPFSRPADSGTHPKVGIGGRSSST